MGLLGIFERINPIFMPEKFVNLTWLAIAYFGLIVAFILVVALGTSVLGYDSGLNRLLVKHPVRSNISMSIRFVWVVALAWQGNLGAAVALFAAEILGQISLCLLRDKQSKKVTEDAEENIL